jgi:MerR family transcriptional regulator/heat shock protein HspR
VASLSAEGMSLPAISRLIELENTVRLRAQSRSRGRLRDEVESRSRVFAAGASGSVVTLRHGTRVRRATEVVVWRRPPDD